MLCVASLIVLLILSVFSARYRPFVGEAFDCVFRRVTLRPCNTGFDTRVKSTITAWLLQRSEKAAQLFNRSYEVISWIFVLSLFLSLFLSIRGGYLFWSTGSCNGLNQGGFCVLDPSGSNNMISGSGIECRLGGGETGDLTLDNVDLSLFSQNHSAAQSSIVFIGCYGCEYTRETYPLIKKLMQRLEFTTTFLFYPTHKEAEFLLPYDYAVSKVSPRSYSDWVDALYTSAALPVDENEVIQLIENLGISVDDIMTVVAHPDTSRQIQKRINEIDKTGIYGTPTVFINGEPVVGPKPFRVYRMMLTGSWF